MITRATACSRVGSDFQTFTDTDSFRGLFLNLGAPSQCQGMVTAWHLYYELNGCESDDDRSRSTSTTYNAVFVVYQPINSNDHTVSYEVVPGSMKSVTIPCDEDNEERIQSREEIISLEAHEQFMIQRGDVIAVCLPNINRRHALQILEDEGIERNDIYEYTRRRRRIAVRNCNFNRLQEIRSQHLIAKSSYRLYLYAGIGLHTVGNSVDNILILFFLNRYRSSYCHS